MKRALFIIVAMLMFTSVTLAQGRKAGDSMGSFPHIPFEHTLKLSGAKLTKGTYDKVNDKCWGTTFMIDGGDEAMQVQFTYSLDYVAGDPDPKNGNLVTYGTWTMSIFENGRYAGSIFGQLQNGSLHWDLYGDRVTMGAGYLSAKINIVGGTGDYAYVSPTNGSLEAFTNYTGKQPVTGAMVNLTF